MTILDRANDLMKEAAELRDAYIEQGRNECVTLFLEDYDFLLKHGDIANNHFHHYLHGDVEVMRGPRKKKIRKRRPKEVLI